VRSRYLLSGHLTTLRTAGERVEAVPGRVEPDVHSSIVAERPIRLNPRLDRRSLTAVPNPTRELGKPG